MKLIIPMAGRGKRFKDQGFTGPKPFIDVKGEPMVQWSLASVKKVYPQLQDSDIICICLQEHEDEYQISSKLREIIGDKVTVLFTPSVTEGAACTVLLAKDYISSDEDVLTCDCDQFFICDKFQESREEALKNDWGGLIPTAEKQSDAYSYAKIDNLGNVQETAEKKQISTHAAVGIYYFSKWSYFVDSATNMINKNVRFNNEFYICPVYNELIQAGKIVRIVPTDLWMTLGTPDELKSFLEFVSATNLTV